MCILFRAPALKLTTARLKLLLISGVSSVCRVTGPPVNRGLFAGSAGIASVLSTFIGASSFRSIGTYLKNVEQNYFKKIYRAKQSSKQIRKPNIEIRNKSQNQKIQNWKPKSELFGTLVVLIIWICFGFRISCFEFQICLANSSLVSWLLHIPWR